MKHPVPGILFVNSGVIKPAELSSEAFDSWYCKDHIPDVVAKSGINHAYRYEHVDDDSSPARSLNFLTICGMDDINFTETDEFKSLEGQRPGPSRESIFEKSEFDTRSYELVQVDEAPSTAGSGPAPLLLYATMSHTSDSELDEWYRGEHVTEISKCPGYRRTKRYRLVTRSLLSVFERSFPLAPKWLALHEFDGLGLPWKELAATDETEWAKRVIPVISEVDFGCFKLQKVFEKKSTAKL